MVPTLSFLPSHPIRRESIPASRYDPEVEGKLHVHRMDIGDQVPLSNTELVITMETKPSKVTDAVHQYPYEIVASADPEAIQVDIEKTPMKWVVTIWRWGREGGKGREGRKWRWWNDTLWFVNSLK